MTTEFWAAVDSIVERDARYARDAYGFVVDALETAVQLAGRRGHVSGPQVVEGLLELARSRMGVMAWTVLEKWGVRTSLDVGDIVFQLIDAGILSRREEDAREDFDLSVDFRHVLEERYFEDSEG